MIKQTVWLICCLAPAVGACSDEKACGEGLGKPSYSLDNPSPRATGVALELAGGVSAKIRLRSMTIADVAVTGTENYSTWRVTIPPSVVETHRNGDTSTLSVKIRDACDAATELDPVIVKAEAEGGTSVDNLAVELKTTDCFLPADGSQRTEISVSAPAEAAGVRVALTTSAGALLATRDSDRTVVLALGGTGAEAKAFLHTAATADALVSVTANAGTAFAYTPAYPVAVAPRYVGPTSLTNGKPSFVSVLTAGRLKGCSATSTVSGAALFSYGAAEPKNILNAKAEAINVDGCSQTALFRIDFGAGTPAGAVLMLACTDQLDQASSYLLTSQGDPPPPVPP